MNQSKIYLLYHVRNVSGDVEVVGYTQDTDFAEKWCEKDPYYRQYEEIKEIRE